MRLLLDENLPKRLKLDFSDHEIFTVRDKEWTGIKNGKLLSLLLENGFDALHLIKISVINRIFQNTQSLFLF